MYRLTAIAVLAGIAAGANAQFFSFASDTSDSFWTFKGVSHGDHYAIINGTRNEDTVELLIDDSNGDLPALSFETVFRFHADLTHVASTPIGGGKFLHSYRLGRTTGGWYTDDGPILTMGFDGSLLTIVGDEFSWDSAGSIFGSDSWADVTYFAGIDLPDYGIFEGQSIGPADMSFSISALNSSGVIPYDFSSPGTELDHHHRLPVGEIWAEGSYSGSARFIPAPAGAALLLVGGLFGARRRR
jgi:hypothetical protein